MCLTVTAPSGGATFEGIHWCIIDWRRVTLRRIVHCQSFVFCGQSPEWCFTDIAETIDSTGLMANSLATLNFWSTNSWHRTKSGNPTNQPYTLKHAFIWKIKINQLIKRVIIHTTSQMQSRVHVCPCQHETGPSGVTLPAWPSWLIPQTFLAVRRREDDSLHFRPHRSDCLHASAGWQGPRDVSWHPDYCQLRHVHHDPGHVLRHPKCGRPQSASPNSQHAHNAKLGSKGKASFNIYPN